MRNAVQHLADVIPDRWVAKLVAPCFVVGCPRSGSSLFDQLLGSHPKIMAYPSEAIDLWHPQSFPWHVACERHALPPIWADARAFTDFSLAHRTEQQDRRIQRSFALCRSLSRRATFVQKCTMIGLMLDHVMKLFPDAVFIHIVRDGRATALSWTKRQGAHIRSYPETYERVGWNVTEPQLLRFAPRLGATLWTPSISRYRSYPWMQTRFIELKYEELCANPEPVLQHTAKFLGIDQAGFDRRLCDAIQSQNFKVSHELAQPDRRELDEIMGETLRRKGYGATC